MLDFSFYNPTRIHFGRDCLKALEKEIPAEARVLLLYGGGSVQRLGTLDEVRAALGARTIIAFGGIEPNPSYETLMQAVALGREQQADFILALGGGSVIDGSKFVAAAIPFAGDCWDIMASAGRKVKAALPLGVVLTLAATGSESNSGAVITRASTHDKVFFGNSRVFPRFACLDPRRTMSLPARQVANGVVDAFVHVMEQYLTYPVNAKVQDRFAEGLLLTLIEEGPKALSAPEDYEVRANLMWAATQALNGLIGAGVPQDWATHMIGHELTALHGLDHAQTLAVVLPNMLAERAESKREKLLQYAERVWGITVGDEAARMTLAIQKTREFFESLGVKTRLSAYGVDESAIAPLLAKLQEHGMVKLGEKGEVDLSVSEAVLRRSL